MASVHFEQLRFYEKDMPDVKDLVKVKVVQLNEMSAYVQLLEYGNAEGMIPFTELSRRRIRSLARHVRKGQLLIAQVIRLDRAKGYIDLSKKLVTEEERQRCEERYAKARAVHTIMRHAAEVMGIPPLEVLKTVSWPLYAQFGHAYDALKLAIVDPDGAFGKLTISDGLRDQLLTIVRQKLRAQTLKIRIDVNVTCFERDGIDAIRDILRSAKDEGMREPKMEIQITIISPPLFAIRTQTENRDAGIKKLKDVIEVMRIATLDRGGSVEVVSGPKIIGDDGEEIKENAPEPQEDESEDDD